MKDSLRTLIGAMLKLAVLVSLVIGPLAGTGLGAEEVGVPVESYPGLNEVIPQATAIVAKLEASETQIKQVDTLKATYEELDKYVETLNTLEKQFVGWEDAVNWPMNRLLSAESRYSDLSDQLQKPLGALNTTLKNLEELRSGWVQQKDYWQAWQEALKQQKVQLPLETFAKTRQGIESILNRIKQASGTLVLAQQKYSSTEEMIESRLNHIDQTLDTLRRDAFRQSTYSLFEPDFYLQIDSDLFTDFTTNIVPTVRLPEGFLDRYRASIILQLICTLIVTGLIILRRRHSRPINQEWKFLFRRPLAGGLFITLATLAPFSNNLYSNIPPSWRWLMMIIMTVAGIRLLSAIYEKPLARRILRILAILFVLTDTLMLIGLPLPLIQLYHVVLCAITLPVCLLLARRHQQHAQRLEFPGIAMYVISLVALAGLISSVFGFVSLTTGLIDATLTTLILFLLVQMALRLVDGGITAFMRLNSIRDRKLILRLGIRQTSQKLKTLAHLIILVQAMFSLLVAWNIFDNSQEAREAFMQIEYSVGEFTFSVEMVVLVVIVLYVTTLLSWLLQAFLDTQIMMPRNMDIGVRASMKRLTQYALYTIGFLIAISMAGIGLERFTILAGAFGVGIGFGLQNIVNNFVSGLILLFERPVKVGDLISLDNQWCTITKIGLRSTIVETLDRAEIIVPNSELIAQKVTNWTFTTKTSRLVIPVGVAYGSDLNKVLKILDQVGKDHPGVMSDPPVSTIFTNFGSSSLDFELRVWVSDIDSRLKIKSELCLAIDQAFREAGVSIPFPQRDLHLRSIETNLEGFFRAPTSPSEP